MKNCSPIKNSLTCFYLLLLLALLFADFRPLHAVSCSVIHHNPPTEAEKALLASDYDKARSKSR